MEEKKLSECTLNEKWSKYTDLTKKTNSEGSINYMTGV